MKNNVIYIIIKRVLLLLYILTQAISSLYAREDILYSSHLSTQTPYKNEAIILDVNLSQIDHSKVMLFNFTLKDKKNYTFHQVKFTKNEQYHDVKHSYRYLICPQVEGNVSIEFELIQSLTDDDKVAYAISGDRDNVKSLEKEKISIDIDPLLISVKSLPSETDLVGNFQLDYKIDKKEAEAYEPIPLKIKLKGEGDLSVFSFLSTKGNYHLFTQAPKIQKYYSDRGIESQIEWNYALSSKESFILEEVKLNVFNPQTEQSYFLIMPSQSIDIKSVNREIILDKENHPKLSTVMDWSWLGWLFSYVIIFIAGYLTPKKFWKKEDTVLNSREQIFRTRVQQTKTHRELLQLLLSENAIQYYESIQQLEEVVYYNKKMPLREIKLNIGTV